MSLSAISLLYRDSWTYWTANPDSYSEMRTENIYFDTNLYFKKISFVLYESD